MSPQFEIARHRLQLARETLDDADVLISQSRWRGALNRLYYASFYAARALLAIRDLDSARHSGVIALFQQHFVKTDLVPLVVGRTLPRVFEARQTSDYSDFSDMANGDVRLLRAEIATFISTCEHVVEQLAAADANGT